MKKYYDNEKISRIKYLIKNEKIELALQEIEEYKIIYPYDLIINKYYAGILCKKGLYKEAEDICLDSLNLNFHDENLKGDMYATLGNTYYYQEKIDKAIDAFEMAYKTRQKNTQVIQIKLSELYAKKGEYDKAKKILDENIDNDSNKQLLLKKGVLLYNKGKYNDALDLLLDINDIDLKTTKDIQTKNLHIGNIYLKRFELDNAKNYFKRVLLSKNNYYWLSYYNIGKIKYFEGYIDEALNIFEETLNNFINDELLEYTIKAYLIKGNNNRIEELIKKFESNLLKKLYLGRLELAKYNYDEAEHIFENILTENKGNNYVYSDYVKYFNIITKFRLEKYEETLKLINNTENDKIFKERYARDLFFIQFYIDNKLNNNTKSNRYIEDQIVFYSKEKAINHIKNNHGYNHKISKFRDDINIEELYNYIYNLIDENKKIIQGPLDKYTINFNGEIGNDNIRNLNSVSVVCLPNTKKIITMYPDRYEDKIEDELDEEFVEKPKVKRLSQIEKFNKKYNMN